MLRIMYNGFRAICATLIFLLIAYGLTIYIVEVFKQKNIVIGIFNAVLVLSGVGWFICYSIIALKSYLPKES